MGCLPLAVTTHFCLTRTSKRSLVGTDRSTIWRYFISMRLYLAMLLYSWIRRKISWNHGVPKNRRVKTVRTSDVLSITNLSRLLNEHLIRKLGKTSKKVRKLHISFTFTNFSTSFCSFLFSVLFLFFRVFNSKLNKCS